MRRTLFTLSGYLILTASSSGTELALVNADTPSHVSITLGAGYTSGYVDRGEFSGKDLLEFGLEASGSAEFCYLGEVTLTGGLSYASYSGGKEFTIHGEVSRDLGPFRIATGIINDSYFGSETTMNDDLESYLALETDLAGFSIGVMACHDASDGYGYDMYWECFAQYVMDLGSLSLGLSATSGYFDDSVEYCALSVFLDIPVSDRINLSTHFTTTFSEDLGDHTFVGIGIGFGL